MTRPNKAISDDPARAPGKVRFLPDPKQPGPVLLNMADVKAEPVRWLWPGRIAVGCLTLIVGAPGTGKSFATIDLAARVTSGQAWPDGAACESPGGVVLVSPEDDPGQVIRPRLEAARADLSRVTLIDCVRVTGENGRVVERGYSLAELAHTEAAIAATPDCRLLVIDPVGSVIGGEVDGHRDNEVRGVLAPLAKLARDNGIAVVLVLHTRKSGGGTADDRALGSRGFVGIARAVHHIIPETNDPDTRRLWLPGKINIGRKPPGLAFKIEGEPAAVMWEPEPLPATLTADRAYRLADDHGEAEADDGVEPEATASALQDAECVLARLLIDGPRRCGDRGRPEPFTIRAESREAGVFERTLQRAKDTLKVIACREAGGWHWRLPRGGDGQYLLPERVRQVVADDALPAPKAEKLAHLAHLAHNELHIENAGDVEQNAKQVRHDAGRSDSADARATMPARTTAAEWLAATLAEGPLPAADVRQRAKDAGLSWHKVSRAADVQPVVIELAEADAPARWRLRDNATPGHDRSDDAA